VFKNGKSLELSEFNQYTMSSDKLSPTLDNYSLHGCSKNTTSNKSNTSQPSTLKSLQNQKISQLNCNAIEDYLMTSQQPPGVHDYMPQKSSTLRNQNSFETSLDENFSGGAAPSGNQIDGDAIVNATIQPDIETTYMSNNTARLSRQDSDCRRKREAERIQKAQENALKLRHVSPVRLRSASDTIFGTNCGKETILDLLQSKEPEEVLALKIELISQIYESLKLSDLSSDIVKEMTLEMEKVSQFVSLNLGRAFIDNFDLKIKAKTVTCAQLLAKVFKHKGSHISVSQFLHFLHQFGDRQVAEAYCDLLIRWYRHETSRHRMTGQFSQGNATINTIKQSATISSKSHPAMSLVANYPNGGGSGGGSMITPQVGYGTPGMSHSRHHMMAPMSRHSLAVPTNIQVQPFSNESQIPQLSNHHLQKYQQQPQTLAGNQQITTDEIESGDRRYYSMQNNSHNQEQTAQAQFNHNHNQHEQIEQHPLQGITAVSKAMTSQNNQRNQQQQQLSSQNMMQQRQQLHINQQPSLHQSLHYASTDVPMPGGLRGTGQQQQQQMAINNATWQMGVPNNHVSEVHPPQLLPGVQPGVQQQHGPIRQPQQRFMPQEEINSECGEDDVFA